VIHIIEISHLGEVLVTGHDVEASSRVTFGGCDHTIRRISRWME
jgi:hypothetical protein